MRSRRPTPPTRRARRASCQPLAGIPLGIKDLFATEGVDTTAGSHILKGFKPPYESTVTANLRKAGAGMLGKLNMDEFAMGSSNETSAYGPVISPVAAQGQQCRRSRRAARRAGRRRRSRPGSRPARPAPTPAARSASRPPSPASAGSSRPTAAARAGASSPSPARSTRRGRWRTSVRDCAILLEAMAGFDPKDSTSLDLPVPQWEANLSSDLSGKRVGIPKEYRIDGMPGEIDALWDAGHRVAEGRGRRAGRDHPAAHQICAADLLHHRAGRGLVEPRAL